MPLNIDAAWSKPVKLRLASAGAIYECEDLSALPTEAGVYIFFRQHGDRIEPLYVGKSKNVRRRVIEHLNSVKLMTAIYESRSGTKGILSCTPTLKRGQDISKVLRVLENALIDYMMGQGYELKQKQGTKRPNHQLQFIGNRTSEALVPRKMRVRP